MHAIIRRRWLVLSLHVHHCCMLSQHLLHLTPASEPQWRLLESRAPSTTTTTRPFIGSRAQPPALSQFAADMKPTCCEPLHVHNTQSRVHHGTVPSHSQFGVNPNLWQEKDQQHAQHAQHQRPRRRQTRQNRQDQRPHPQAAAVAAAASIAQSRYRPPALRRQSCKATQLASLDTACQQPPDRSDRPRHLKTPRGRLRFTTAAGFPSFVKKRSIPSSSPGASAGRGQVCFPGKQVACRPLPS
ncbi:hypothetical protein QBC34DRAFT_134726 [Podospora aff. communis PSN243]|uniref:Secreted protein n=1 Tax=Podospora aff. communis PSN243 TaxID=3040156 RepID=A0AAV9H1H3_9PEZI|nr:hypothetical protein QBC34DRAFT_134726 [Podospora aff. communis PSN243]